MKMKKSPPELVEFFGGIVAGFPKAERRKLFGYPCLFVKGRMTAGLFQGQFFLRLSEKDWEAFSKLKGSHAFAPMAGRPMKEYLVVPPALLKKPSKLKAWLKKSISYAETLPPKKKKPVK
jgi:TfoX/Sxy family transcriptional regulator of competence genes